MNKVFRPPIPYRGPIFGGLHEGKLIEIRGHVPYGADAFEVNLMTGLKPKSDRPLHISARLRERVVVRNALLHRSWGSEERHGLFPFEAGRDFIMLIELDPRAYRIAVNSQHCWEFSHRVPYSQACTIFIDGSVQVESIEFIDRTTSGIQPSVVCMPNPYPSVQIQPSVCIPNPYPSVGVQPAVCPAIPSSYVGVQPAVCPAVPSSYVVPPPENHIGICPMPSSGFQPSSNLSPVYNPCIPYAYPIYGGLKPGMMIYISGRPSASPYKFTINLQSGTSPYPPPDIAFHLDVRFFNFTVVRNSRNSNVWDREESMHAHFPFQPAVNFDMIIKVERDRYMIALNGVHFLEFRHRLTPLSRFNTLYIENDVAVSSIRVS